MQDADLIVAECRELIAEHGLDPALARDVVAKAMVGEQPLPLREARDRRAGDVPVGVRPSGKLRLTLR